MSIPPMLPGTMLPHIRIMLPTLSPSERRLGELVLADPDGAVYSSVTALAKVAAVGEATVLRFCRALGFKGFKEFKLLLSRELTVPVPEPVTGHVEAGDDLATLRTKGLASAIATLQETAGLVNLTQLEKAVHFLEKAGQVLFYGVGLSAQTAQEAAGKFLRIGLTCRAVPDSHVGAMAASLLRENDVVVGISQSGSSRDTVDALQTARLAGAVTIAITGNPRSPITRQADAILLAAPRENVLPCEPFTGKIAQLYILDLLLTALTLRSPQRAAAYADMTARATARKSY